MIEKHVQQKVDGKACVKQVAILDVSLETKKIAILCNITCTHTKQKLTTVPMNSSRIPSTHFTAKHVFLFSMFTLTGTQTSS